MSAPRKGHWDFGELFSAREIRQVISVSELSGRVKRVLETNWASIWVCGEITNFRAQSSGHLYFSLKDANAQIQCVCFRGDAPRCRHQIGEGQQVVVQGDLTLYELRGQYQLVVRQIEPAGQGALQRAFEMLKEALRKEGLFDSARKRSIPRFPQRVGLVTSKTGAAVQDVFQSVRRRNPALEIVFAPCRVQGDGAAREIADRIRLLNEWSAAAAVRMEAILVVRGGGSLEDLWAFNEEAVARAVAESAIPIVSGVGHETDITICDLVADVRAATPTAAAELVTEGIFSIRGSIPKAFSRIARVSRRVLRERMDNIQQSAKRLEMCHPRKQLQQRWQRLDEVTDALRFRMGIRLKESTIKHRVVSERFLRIKLRSRMVRSNEVVGALWTDLETSWLRAIEVRSRKLETSAERLRLLSPKAVLDRGFSITIDAATRKIVRSPQEVSEGAVLRSILAGGEICSVVRGVYEEAAPGLAREEG